jgi:hypothetical protein
MGNPAITLLHEEVDLESVDIEIVEEASDHPGKEKQKSYFISGPYLQAEVKNGNGRTYPKKVLESQVKAFNESRIAHNRAMGELGHPSTTEINLDRVSHLIKELKMDGNNGVGKALVMDTPMGKIAKSLIDAGVKLGVSTRGVGTLKENVVQNDFRLITVDIVADPSAPNAFVEGILESSKEWIIKDGVLTERDIDEVEEELMTFTTKDVNTAAKKVFEDFIKKLTEKY